MHVVLVYDNISVLMAPPFCPIIVIRPERGHGDKGQIGYTEHMYLFYLTSTMVEVLVETASTSTFVL